MSVGQKLAIVFSAFLCAICIGINAWYLYVRLYGPDKVISNTYEIGLQTTQNGDSRYFAELNYFSNKNKNGLEMFEIKFNYMLDENQEAFYSQGLQYVGKTKNDKISWNYYRDATQIKGEWLGKKTGWYDNEYNYGWWGSYNVNSSISKFNYASGDDYKSVALSTNPISLDTRFKIQLGKNLFLMKFKNNETEMTSQNFMYKAEGAYHFYVVYGVQDYNWYYAYYDVNYFAKLLYQSISKSVTPGTNSAFIFEFGDLFDYYIYDEEKGSYSDTKYKNVDSVIQDMKSYYSIKVNVSENGVQKSSESLFGAVNGTTTFNLTGDYSSDDYFIGRSVVRVTEKDFVLVQIYGDYYALKLRDDFVKYFSQYSKIKLSILINKDEIKKQDVTVLGFADDNNLDKFEILDFYSVETIDGEKVKKEVDYVSNVI